MEYTIYQLEFKTGVHFGTGMLNESVCTFKADQIFSALYIEALKLNLQQQLYDAVKKGNLLISDAFPYIGQQYMIPKPMIYVEPINRGESKQKKAYKKMKCNAAIRFLDVFHPDNGFVAPPVGQLAFGVAAGVALD